MMNNRKTYKLSVASVFCALVFTMTWIAIPAPSFGNINLGDCMIILCACLIGDWYGVLSCALGASMCDIVSGYAIYAPGTFVIKALMTVVIIFTRRHVTQKHKVLYLVLPAVFAEIVMVFGYFVYEALILKYGLGAIVNIPFNLIQGSINILVAVFLFTMLKKSGLVKNL